MKIIITVLAICYLVSGEINLQNVEVPNIDDFSAIREKCDKLGGNGTYNNFKESQDRLQTCAQQFVDFTVLNNEVEEAKKTGSMDEVFGKYCAKKQTLVTCVNDFTAALRPCLSDEEKNALNITLDILKQLGEFVCFRDGDRIAMFVAEGGVECIRDHAEGIKNCINSTFKISTNINNMNSVPNLLIDKKKCDDLGKLQNCVVEELEKCKDSTPANIVDALFRFIKRSACSNKNKRSIHSIIKRSATFANNFYNVDQAKAKIMNLMKDKCVNNAPEGSFETLKEFLNNATECMSLKAKSEPILTIPSDKFKANFATCTEDLVANIKVCLPDKEKYWPQFQIDVVNSLVDFIYKNKDKMTVQNYRMEVINCFQNFQQSEAKNEMAKCFKEPENYDNFNKEAICGTFKTVKSCVTEELQKRCIREISIFRMTDEFFDALSSPCNKNY